MNRREFISSGLSALGMGAIAAPIRSVVGAAETGIGESPVPTAASYIQDGLIALWDGIENIGLNEHDDSSAVWVDLVNGVEAVCNTTPVWEDDGFNFGSGNRRFVFQITEDLYNAIVGNSITAECRIGQINSTKNDNGMFGIGTARYSYNGFGLKVNNQSNTACDFIARGTTAPSVNYYFPESTYFGKVNGNAVTLGNNAVAKATRTSASETVIDPAGTFMLGNMGIASNLGGFGGTIHCFRFYNRPLSEAELAYNRSIDEERFAL